MISKSRTLASPLVTGQVWQLADSKLQIGVVGKTLVHYKHFKGQTKRAPISLALKEVLGKYLRVNKAVLVRRPTMATV